MLLTSYAPFLAHFCCADSAYCVRKLRKSGDVDIGLMLPYAAGSLGPAPGYNGRGQRLFLGVNFAIGEPNGKPERKPAGEPGGQRLIGEQTGEPGGEQKHFPRLCG
jgi:hypothetical protein